VNVELSVRDVEPVDDELAVLVPLEEPDRVAELEAVRDGEVVAVEDEEGVDVPERELELVSVAVLEAALVGEEELVNDEEPVCEGEEDPV
jgi:hypothetical protein